MINANNSGNNDLFEYWRVVLKRKWIILAFTGALIFFTGLFTFLAEPIYESMTTIHIDEEYSRVLSIDETLGYQTQVRDMRFFNTQLRLLKSKSLAEKVARKMNLISRPEFNPNSNRKKSLFSSAKDLFTLKWLSSKKEDVNDLARAANPIDPYSNLANRIRNGIEVKPIRNTKLVEVTFSSPSPLLAAEIVNTLAEEFISFSVEKRYATTQQASDFLSAQIANLREDLASKERELLRYGQEKDLGFLSDTETTAMNKLEELEGAYTQAQLERISAQAEYEELKNLEVDSIPQSITNPLIQQLRTEYTRTKTEYDEKSKVFKANYPEMIQLKAKLDSMEGELRKAVDAAESDYRSSLNRERNLRQLLNSQKANVAATSSNAILYNSLRIEVDNKRKLLNSLIERQTETQVSAQLGGLKASNIWVIDKGEVPRNPVYPKKKLNLMLALIFGLAGGIVLCFLLEYLDNTVKGDEDIEKLFGLSSLGVVPYLSPDGMKKGKNSGYYGAYRYSYKDYTHASESSMPEIKEIELVNFHYPQISLSEDYRTIRTSLLLSHAGNPPKVIVFTSAMSKEGKSSTVANMAVSFAQLDERVLVIDADMRKPRIHKIFDVDNSGGLSGYLAGKVFIRNAIQRSAIDNVWILPAGLIPPNPAELLNSKKMNELIEVVKKGYDIVLIDSPPVLAVVDSVIVSTLADGTVFIVKTGHTTYKMLGNAIEELNKANAKVLGLVFNEIKAGRGEYYYMDYYRYRDYSYEETEAEETD